MITMQFSGRIDKTKQIKDGATMLNRTQVKPTRNSKKIRGNDGNKSDSPHLRGKSSCCRELTRRWSIKERKLKLQSFNFVFCRTWQLGRAYIVYTGRAPAAARGPATGSDAEGFFFLELLRLPPPG